MHSVGRRVLGGVVGVAGEAEAGEVGGGGGSPLDSDRFNPFLSTQLSFLEVGRLKNSSRSN